MKAVRAAVILTVLALTAALPAHAASKDDVVKFYQGYLELVSASNFVTLSRERVAGSARHAKGSRSPAARCTRPRSAA